MFQKLACNPHLTRHRCFYWSLFHPICLKTFFSIFPLFQSAEKRVFSNFLELGTFYGFGHQNHSEQVQKMWLRFLVDFEQLFLFFWKKTFFPFLTQLFDGKKLKKFKTIKNSFWWLIRAYHSQFSRYRVFKSQNWIKFVVFAIFLFWRFMVKLVYTLLCQFLEQLFRSQNCLSVSAEILLVAWIYSRNLHVILIMVFLIKFFSISLKKTFPLSVFYVSKKVINDISQIE